MQNTLTRLLIALVLFSGVLLGQKETAKIGGPMEADTTATLTNKSYNVGGTGNIFTTFDEVIGYFATCSGGSPALALDDAGTGDTAPTAACNDAGSIQRPSADYAGDAVNSLEITIPLPAGWNSVALGFDMWYATDAATPSGNVEWDISTVCRAVAEDWDGSFNAAQTITDAVGADEAINIASQASLTTTGCASSENLTVKISRDGTNDTNNDLAKALLWRMTVWRNL